MLKRNALSILAAMLVVSGSAWAGWQYTAVTTSERGSRGMTTNGIVNGWVNGDAARIEFVKSGGPLMAAGSYLLTKDGGKTVQLVSPKDKSYAKWDMAGMIDIAGGAMKMLGMKISDFKTEKLLDEDGGTIAGCPTRHYRFHTSFTMEMNMLGTKRTTLIVRDSDVWTTTKVTDSAIGVWLKNQDFKTGNEQFDAVIKSEMATMQGFPLRNIATQTSKDDQGKERTTKTVMEVTELKPSKPSADLFEVPSDYTETSLLPTEEGGDASKGNGGDNPLLKMLQKKLQQ